MLLRPSKASTTALPAPQGPSGIPEVPSSGLPSPPSSPPLAAITANNQLALTPKKRSGGGNNTRSNSHRRGGAALRIREECERFFCETMKTVFSGESDTAIRGSGLTSVRYNNGQLATPPDEYPFPDKTGRAISASGPGGGASGVGIPAWLEIWDYVGGTSFRAFVAEDEEERTLFAFFDSGIVGRDLKQALVALIELSDTPLSCAQLVVCIDRSIPADEAKALMKGLEWAGFSLTTLDFWANGTDVTSKRWVFMGMEI